MTNFIPFFPLDIVVFPGEKLNLHIFEPRYKQLIKDCVEGKKVFGIPFVQNNALEEMGTTMRIEQVVKEYDHGEMDIITQGVQVFRTLELIADLPDKLYKGAIVSYPENEMTPDDSKIASLILDEVKKLYSLMNVSDKFPPHKEPLNSYSIAHFVGLSRSQEYEFLQLLKEVQRLEYLRRHLKSMKPFLEDLAEMKERVQRNGHFRNISLDNF